MKTFHSAVLLLCASLTASCVSTQYLDVSGVAYQSIQSATGYVGPDSIPSEASIVVFHSVDDWGRLDVTVRNNTDQVMTIDRTKTFFRDQGGNDIPYYDPTVRTSTKSTTTGTENGANVNLGSIASAVGIGGALGTALGGVNVGGSNTSAVTNSETTYYIDQPQISIAPHGQANLGRTFPISGVGYPFLIQAIKQAQTDVANTFTPRQTYAACNVCVSYSIDGGKTYQTILTDIFANSLLVGKVRQAGQVNNALRSIYINKPDALSEHWFLLFFSGQGNNNTYRKNPELINFK